MSAPYPNKALELDAPLSLPLVNKNMEFTLEVWTKIASIAACFAAIVALIPIYQSNAAKKAKARNLRMRIAIKLTRIKPTFFRLSDNHQNPVDSVILSNEELINILSQLEALLSESEYLTPSEQDHISQFVANLELMLPFHKTDELTSDSAENLLLLCDRTINEIEKNGISHKKPHSPWEQ